jgi:hypothetical protein
MRTFLRISLLGNAFLDLACILLLLHSRGNHVPDAAFLSERTPEQVAVDSKTPIGVFAVEAPFAPCELPGSYSGEFSDGNTTPVELVQVGGIPTYTTAYDVGRPNWRFEGMPLALRWGEGAYPRPSP